MIETFLLLPSTSWFEAPEQTDSARWPNGCRGGLALPGLYVMVIKACGTRFESSALGLCLCRCLLCGCIDKAKNLYWDRISSKIRKSGQQGFVGFFSVHPVSASFGGRPTDDHNRQVCKGRRKHDTMRRKSVKEQLKVPLSEKFPLLVFSNKHFLDIWTVLN